MEAPRREVYLIIYHSPQFPAHWGLWIPSTANPDIGKMIHAVGDVMNGFVLEFKRNYSISATQRAHSVVLLATVDVHHVVDVPGNGSRSTDTIAADDIERKALAIPTPGKTLNSSIDGKKKVELKNCQTWLHELVEALVADNIFPDSALAILSTARKN